jgi:hypothetical protein
MSQSQIPHFHWHFATLEDCPDVIHSIDHRESIRRTSVFFHSCNLVFLYGLFEIILSFFIAANAFWIVYLGSFYHFAVYPEDHAALEKIAMIKS